MSEVQGGEAGKPKAGVLKIALWGVAILGIATIAYIIAQSSINPQQPTNLKAYAKGDMARLVFPLEAAPAPVSSFQDSEGKLHRIADFRGKVTVVNVWATWCGPCVIEMPTLASLAKAYEGKDVVVVPVSIDSDDKTDQAKAFIAKNAPLTYYHDPKKALPFEFKPPAVGMPTTVIYGKDGVEKARISGEADWSGPQAKALIDHLLAEPE